MRKLLILGFLVSVVACSAQEDPRKQILRDLSTGGTDGIAGDELNCYIETLFEDASSEQIDAMINMQNSEEPDMDDFANIGQRMQEMMVVMGPALSAMGKCGISPNL